MIRDREDDLDLEVERERFESQSGKQDMVRGMQSAYRTIRADADIPRKVVPLKMRTDSYREIRKRHTVRKQADRSLH